jgi:hypothetical protein
MLTVLDIFFYLTLVPFYVASYRVLKRWVPVLSLSGIFLILNFIFVIIPGYFNYRGGILFEADAEINTTAYVLYYLQGLLPPFAIYASWRLSGPPILTVRRRLGVKPIFAGVLLAVIAYDIVYVAYNTAQIPLISVFDGNFDAVALYRSELTHGFSDTDAPWYFGYYRLFTKDLTFLLAIPYFLFARFWRSVPKSLAFVALLFMLLMHVEKTYLLFLFAALYLAQSDFRPPSSKTVAISALSVVALSVIVTYALFSETVSEAFLYLPIRLSGQTGYVVPQLDVFAQYGFLGIRGVRLGIFDRLFSIDPVDVSSLAFSEVHSDLAAAGIEGSSAGASMAELYMIAGYIAPIIFFLAIFLLAQVDKNFRVFATTFPGTSGFDVRLAKSFYIYFVSFYALEPVTSVFGIFSPVTFFQPSLLVAVLLYALFFRVGFRSSASILAPSTGI